MSAAIVMVEPGDLFLGLEDPTRFKRRYGIENPSEYNIIWSRKHGRFQFIPKRLSMLDDVFGDVLGKH